MIDLAVKPHALVWVVQEGKNDYSTAEHHYGEVRFITTSDLMPMANSSRNKEVAFDIKRFKADYVAEVDYIIPVGNPMVVALVTLSLPKGKHNFLKWDGRKALYIPFVLDGDMVK